MKRINFYFLFIICLLFSSLRLSGSPYSQDIRNFENDRWDSSIDLSNYIPILTRGKIVHAQDMRTYLEERGKIAKFSNEVLFVILESDNRFVAAVCKPKSEEQKSAAIAESIAYTLWEECFAPFTHLHAIPPTVVRQLPDGKWASIQYFVKTGNEEDLWRPDYRKTTFETCDTDAVNQISVFNTLFNDWDCHPGNYLATLNEGRVHLARIDNESIENKGRILKWGERPYIPVLFSEDPIAIPRIEIDLKPDLLLESFIELVESFGFEKFGSTRIYPYAVDEKNRSSLLVESGILWLRFHQNNPGAFPLPKPPYHPILLEALYELNEQSLNRIYAPLIECDPDRFSGRVADVLER